MFIIWWYIIKIIKFTLYCSFYGGIINKTPLKGGWHLGRRLFQQIHVSPDRTELLRLPQLQVVSELDVPDKKDKTYHAVHSSYFTKYKPPCPICGASHTAETKIIPRNFKDLLPTDDDRVKVIDLVFHQRYFRCLDCGNFVFHEGIDFAEEGCKFTNRLSDLIAEGTLTRTYERVCKDYGVPASKASVGIIMRRRMQQRADSQPPLKTPDSLVVFVPEFFSDAHPMVLGIYGRDVRLLDVLNASSMMDYRLFFQQLDCKAVKQVFIDPDEQLHSAVVGACPDAEISISEEYIHRCARQALKETIKKEGNHCCIHRRYYALTVPESYLTQGEHGRVNAGMKKLPRIRAAYNAYQDLLRRMESGWTIRLLQEWLGSLPDYVSDEQAEGESIQPLNEFGILEDVLSLYRNQIQAYLDSTNKPPAGMESAVTGILDAIEEMPYCIYDVLRARMLLNVEQEIVETDGQKYRTGVRIEKLTEKMNHIAWQIKTKKECEEYGYDTED